MTDANFRGVLILVTLSKKSILEVSEFASAFFCWQIELPKYQIKNIMKRYRVTKNEYYDNYASLSPWQVYVIHSVDRCRTIP